MAQFLKSLELFGFKSFADRTRIEFSAGTTALLGPNGCGKSNIVDAIKWVLGEQGTKTLRADSGKMLDVIFKGSENRKALNMAEVALVISNEMGLLPTDASEVEIRRRVYRNGDSEYFINREKCRLKDIRDLFLDTGVGKTAYSILEQGKIDKVLSSTPEDRRYIFEEAAGITKYKIQAQEAERKIKGTQENIDQAELLMSEVKKVYDRTKAQAEKLKEFKALSLEKEDLEINTQLSTIQSYQMLKMQRSAEIESKEKQLVQINTLISEYEADLADDEDLHGDLLDKKNQLESDIRVAETKIEHVESLIARIRGDYNEEAQNRDRVTLDAQNIERQMSDKQREKEQADNKIAHIDEQLAIIEKSKRSTEDNINSLRVLIKGNLNEIETCEKKIEENQDALDNFHQKMAEIADKIVNELDTKLKESGYSTVIRQRIEREFIEKLNKLTNSTKENQKFIDGLKKVKAPVEKVIKIFEDHIELALEILFDLKGSFQEYSGSIPTFLDELIAPEGIITAKHNLENQVKGARKAIDVAKQRILKLKEDNLSSEEKIEEYSEIINRLNEDKSAYEEKKSESIVVLRVIESDLNHLQESYNRYVLEIKEIERKLLKFLEEIKQNATIKNEHLEIIENSKDELTSILMQMDKNNATSGKKRLEVAQKKEEIRHLESSVAELKGRNEGLDEAIEKVYVDFFEETGTSLTDYDDRLKKDLADSEKLSKELHIIKEKIKKLGNINHMSESEFEEAKTQYEFYDVQIRDLLKAKEDLEEVRSQIIETSTTMFLDAYYKIKEKYAQMFKNLFNGGRADLRLDNEDDVLNCGIEIIAQPPGTKLNTLSLLSGGQRSMTAVAILFATYQVKPSPFCILDEIDAALDDKNIGYFISVLQDFSKTSQFIVITHNTHTVRGTETLLGVTMQERGVTKTVSYRKGEEEGKPVIFDA